MFKENEIDYHECESFIFSNIILSKLNDRGLGPKSVSSIDSQSERSDLINFLKKLADSDLIDLGLKRVQTNDVHDVSFGSQPIGDFYFCDMISGITELNKAKKVLDFGCSSGRVIRNLNSAFDICSYGCDPRKMSIEFNLSNFPELDWFVSNEKPPIISKRTYLEFFDLSFAISVWSHFSEARALEWFDEFHRLTTKGGRLVFSTHGTRSVYHFLKVKKNMPEKRALERLEVLRNGGFHFMPYPKGSDLDTDHWGMAFISREWLERKISDQWEIEAYYPGMAMKNQDVFALRKL